MNSRDIRDRSGRVIARETTTPNGDVEVRDRMGSYLGKATQSGTRDRMGRVVAQSNAPGLLYPRR